MAYFMAASEAANKGRPSRKAFPEVFMAWSQFVVKNPNSVLYVHSHIGEEMAGLDLLFLARQCGIPDGKLRFCDPYWNIVGFPDTYMANVYRAADVLLSPSYGEGFGIPILEAQACGTPVIVGDNTAMRELCFYGWKVSGTPMYTPMGSWQFAPSVPEIVRYLERAMKERKNTRDRKIAVDAAQEYDYRLVTKKHWKPVLDELEAEVAEAGAGNEMVKLYDASARGPDDTGAVSHIPGDGGSTEDGLATGGGAAVAGECAHAALEG